MGWIGEHGWEAWLVLGLVLAAAELTTLDLTLLMLAIGCAAAALLALIGLGTVVQVVFAAGVSVALLGLVRPNIVKRLHAGPTLETGPARLIGANGLVLERVTAHTGRIKLAGEIWSARSLGNAGVIEPGSTVAVAEIDGATAVVYEVQ